MKNIKRKVQPGKTVGFGLLYGVMLALVAFVLYPVVYAFFGSFKSTIEFMNGGVRLLPETWRVQNYADALKKAQFSVYTLNSFLFSFLSIAGVLSVCSMAGFLLSRRSFVGKKLMMVGFGASMFLTGATTIFPVFKLCKTMGLLNSLWGMVIVQVAWSIPFYAILIMGYCEGIPKSIDESAHLDGCSIWGVYTRIMLPMIRPILATAALLQFREAWNSFMMPLAFTLSRPKLRTLAVGIVSLKDSGGDGISSWNLMIAGTMISLIPILVVYLFMNRFFISGVTEGALKG